MQKSCFGHELSGSVLIKRGHSLCPFFSRLSARTLLILERGLLATYLPFSSTDSVFCHFTAPKQMDAVWMLSDRVFLLPPLAKTCIGNTQFEEFRDRFIALSLFSIGFGSLFGRSRRLETAISSWFSFQRTVHGSSLIFPRFFSSTFFLFFRYLKNG